MIIPASKLSNFQIVSPADYSIAKSNKSSSNIKFSTLNGKHVHHQNYLDNFDEYRLQSSRNFLRLYDLSKASEHTLGTI